MRTYSRVNTPDTRDAPKSPATPPKKLRADTRRTREHLLDVLGRLLEEQGLDVSLPDLARESGVATATVYRHFDDVHELREEFDRRIVETLGVQFDELLDSYRGRELFDRVCAAWVERASAWARAATFIRSAEGFIERVKSGNDLVVRLDRALGEVVRQLIEGGVIPAQDVRYAVLVWITLFDERVLVDLDAGLGWSRPRIVKHLSATVLAALGGSPAEPA